MTLWKKNIIFFSMNKKVWLGKQANTKPNQTQTCTQCESFSNQISCLNFHTYPPASGIAPARASLMFQRPVSCDA